MSLSMFSIYPKELDGRVTGATSKCEAIDQQPNIEVVLYHPCQ